MNKFLLLIITLVSLFYLQFATARTIKISAKHNGHEEITTLCQRHLVIQGLDEFFTSVETDENGIFELDARYIENEIRVYLVKEDGSVLAGCFSRWVPAGLGEVILKGIGCV